MHLFSVRTKYEGVEIPWLLMNEIVKNNLVIGIPFHNVSGLKECKCIDFCLFKLNIVVNIDWVELPNFCCGISSNILLDIPQLSLSTI